MIEKKCVACGGTMLNLGIKQAGIGQIKSKSDFLLF